MKNTETWVLRCTQSTEHGHSKTIDSTSYNFSTGVRETLLSTGAVIKRPKLEGEIAMPIMLMKEVRMNVKEDGRMQNRRFLQAVFEVNTNPKEETAEQRMARLKVEFIKTHHEVSYKNMKGEQLNPNFPNTSRAYFELINLDERESQSAELEILYNELIGSVIAIREDKEELNNFAYGLGLNPQNLSPDGCFNAIKTVIQQDPKKVKNFIENDSDKYHKIVVNKALRVKQAGSDSTYIVQDQNNMFTMNGSILASTYDSLILYFKENKEMFAHLEDALGFKKKESINNSPSHTAEEELESEASNQPKPRGRPKAQ